MVPAQVEAMVGQQIKGTILGMMVALGASKYAYQPEQGRIYVANEYPTFVRTM